MIAGMGWQTYALSVGFSLFIFEGRKTKKSSKLSLRFFCDCLVYNGLGMCSCV